MKHAFSLVELSIVLVILGLLTGGILTGQNLIRAAELRSVTTEFQSYSTAVYTFRDKYFALPGDMTNATDFWTAMTNCNAASPAGTGTQTCNGDGDGRIEQAAAHSQTGEMFGFWQQLANAGLIEGSYNGIAGTVTADRAIIDDNVPNSKLGSAGWSVKYISDQDGTGDFFAGSYNNVMFFGASLTDYTDDPIVSAEEMWGIDKKVDDGRPGYGKVMSTDNTHRPNCATTDSVATAEYDLANTAVGCSVMFLGF